MTRIPKGITRADVLRAIAELDRGASHEFGPSRKFDLLVNGRRYPPKAVLGLAARRRAGRVLRPEDFSGGDQTNRILEGLRFDIVSKKGGRRPRVDRSSAADAETVITTLLAGAPAAGRRAVLRFLARSIEESARAANDRWAVTLEPDHIRFNVGQTESVVLWERMICVLVTDATHIAGTTVDRSRRYPSAGGSLLRDVPLELAAQVLPSLTATHIAAKQLARRRPCTRVVMDAHSPGVVEYLWDALELPGTPPVPSHYGQRRRPLDARALRAALQADKRVQDLPDLTRTEKEVVIKQRLAQRLFRARLKATDCRCWFTGITDQAHLRASHIKPWAECSDRERQDPANGLLLAPHVDHLFDTGYLSFENDGTVLVSPWLDKKVLEAWGLVGVRRVKPFSAAQGKYFEYHRRRVFRRG